MTIPLTVLGGFLGAGKTSVLNGLLARATRRIGVMVNDFGAVSVDATLIAARDGETIALANGCVCCAAGDDLGGAIARLAARNPAPEQIVVEASGVGDPMRIAQIAALEDGVALDAVIALVDAAAFPELLRDRWLTDTLERQLARADLIVLNKCEIASPATLAATRAAVARIRPDAAPVAIASAALPEALIGTGIAPPPGRFLADIPEHGFRSFFWDGLAPFDRDRLRALLDALPRSVVRAKGVVRVGDGAALLQLAGRRWALTNVDAAPTGLVVIGTPDMPEESALAALFRDASGGG